MVPVYTGNWLAAWFMQGVGVIAGNTQCVCCVPACNQEPNIPTVSPADDCKWRDCYQFSTQCHKIPQNCMVQHPRILL